MRVLEDILIEKGLTPDERYKCPSCGKMCRAFAMSVPEAGVSAQKRKVKRHVPDPNHDAAKDADKPVPLLEVEETIDDVVLEGLVCTDCIVDAKRIDNHKKEKAEKERVAREEPWNTDVGKHLKAERNRKIDEANWAINPDTSPLTAKSRADHIKYVKALHRMTIDFARPEDIKWPDAPVPQYQA